MQYPSPNSPASARRKRRGPAVLLSIALVIVLAAGGMFAAVSRWPILGAEGSDLLRSIFGDEFVARLEMGLFQVQDSVQQARYSLGLEKPAAPWQAASTAAPAVPNPASPSPALPATLEPARPASPPDAGRSAATAAAAPAASASPAPPGSPAASGSPTPAAPIWPPAPAKPLGSLPGEGAWSAYIPDPSGRDVAERTFLQPDPQRPYAVVGVVAFDLARTRLHFVLGIDEPYSPDGPKRSGKIASADLVPGMLLVTFNGGFKATHGEFGAMADGITALPPRPGLGTLAIGPDGRVQIGDWGSEIDPAAPYVAWRQNGPLVVHNGQIDPQIYSNSPKDWGYTVSDVSPTWRSAIGLSADGQVLYYFAGSKLTMQALAQSMLTAGVANGIQLDINNYWVHFVALRVQTGKMVPEPLFPEAMTENLDRYLYPYTRDYFYVTALK